MKPNILQTLLSGRKKREMVMEDEVNNKVDTIIPDKDMENRTRLLEIIGVAEDDNCSAQLWNCMETAAEFAFEQANTVRVSKKFNKESHFQALLTDGRNSCKTSYELCVQLKQ